MENICYNCFRSSVDERGICTECGFHQKENHEKYPMALPAGSILYGQYIVGKVLGQGGFGITYVAQDYQTKELVAIKEFFPDIMATRTNSITVTPFAGERGENFTFGRISFLDEAKTMADFNGNPNIVEVYSYFEENGTGYYVMEYIDGYSFQDYIKEHGGRLSWDETVKIVLPVLNALSDVHAKGVIHRDVTPDNIYITKQGTVKLLDFGAARYSLGNVSRSLDVVLKHGFAPKEQYKRHGRQGPYTDVYSVGATIYYALTGVRPDDSIERSDEDTLPLPSILGASVEAWQEAVVLKAMAVAPENRYQSTAEMGTALTQKPAKDERKNKLLQRLILVVIVLVMGASIYVGTLLDAEKENQQVAVEKISTEEQLHEITEVIQQEIPVQTYVMMAAEDISDLDYAVRGEQGFWGQETYSRGTITRITFHDSIEKPPSTAWDVSARQDGTILAWLESGDHIHVAANGRIAPNPNASYMFYYFENLTTIDFGNCFDTSNVINMEEMFGCCQRMESLDLSGFDTQKVTNMKGMFASSSLSNLNISGWNTSNVTDMSKMFFSTNFTELDLSELNTSNVKTMSGMFSFADALVSLELSDFDTSNVTDMSQMFAGCKNLRKLDLSGFDVYNVSKMYSMFRNCSSLKEIDISDFDTYNVESMAEMFSGCTALRNLDVSSFDTSKVKSMESMFNNCINLTVLDLSSFETSQVYEMSSMFSGCSGLNSLNLSGFDTTNIKKYDSPGGLIANMNKDDGLEDMFAGCSSLTDLKCTNKDILKKFRGY